MHYLDYKFNNFFNNIVKKIEFGEINITYPNDANYIFTGSKNGPVADIKLLNYRVIIDILIKGNIGFGESYINNNFSTSNLSKLIQLLVINKDSFNKYSNGNLLYRFIQQILHFKKNNSLKNSVKNISYHYDLGNEFYKYWLDETMSYSSAIFDRKISSLKEAQLNKYKRLLSIIKPSDKSKILEIGCGWGSLASYLARNTSAHVTAVTISKQQHQHVSKLIFEEGLNENVKVELKDYRNINEKYDSIVSIEMFEAVGEQYWPIFFNKLRKNLKYGGRAALQIITISEKLFDNYRSRPDFIQRYIFPGGMLPTKNIIKDLINKEDLKLTDEYNFAESYAKTLNLWNKSFQKSWPDISKNGFNEYFKRMWEYYFAYCEGGFKGGSIDISQFSMLKQ